MKNSGVLFAICLVLLISCQNSEVQKNEEPAAKDSPTIALSQPSTSVNIETPVSDSVFDDGSIPSSWENAGITDPKGLLNFITDLQQWISENQKDSIANHISFPLRNIKSREDFLKKYPMIINDEIRKKIAEQNKRQVFRNENGAMIADGAIWMIQKGEHFVITAINYHAVKR